MIFIFAGATLSTILAFGCYRFGLPIYLDTVGTMFVAAVGGLFPAIATAVVTNMACAAFNGETVYFGFINALIAIYTAWYVRERAFNSVRAILRFLMPVAVFCGVISALIQWLFLGQPQNQSVAATVESFSSRVGMNRLITFILINILLNILDKGLSLGISIAIFHLIPKNIRTRVRNSGWKQKPLSVSDVRKMDSLSAGFKSSLKMKTAAILLGTSLALAVVISWVGVTLYYDNEKDERTLSAENAARFAAESVDPMMINEYIEKGEEVPGYKETKDLLYKIRDNAIGVEYLYIMQIRSDGCYMAIDLDSDLMETYSPGDVVPFEDAFLPYLDDLFEGKKIQPIESADISGWVLTAYYPIIDSNGICRGYAGADVSMAYMTGYMWAFFFRAVLIMSAFFIMILAYSLWSSETGLVYPINSIEMSVEKFIKAGDDQESLDEAVREMRALDIHTDDEIEKMYHIICDMALNQTEKIRSVRRFSESTVKMQDGLILTMADLVESRDSDTGAHVQKTSEYVRIIVNALEKKGYYKEKINSKFKSEVVRSAPLHDVGKINISDKVLNKPGKLNDEEYEIMKTHTTAGRMIIEKAINTVKGESYLKEARNMAAYHHERWDGKGYPEGLHGEVIPLSARIMAVADVFDALSSPRVYKPAFPLEKALSIIEEGSGTQFDPKCVEAFMDSLDDVKMVFSKYNKVVQ